jgi:hypothetical protein
MLFDNQIPDSARNDNGYIFKDDIDEDRVSLEMNRSTRVKIYAPYQNYK